MMEYCLTAWIIPSRTPIRKASPMAATERTSVLGRISPMMARTGRFRVNEYPRLPFASEPIHFTFVEDRARGFWSHLPRLARGRPGKRLIPARGYHSLNGSRIELSIDGPFVIDGEVFSGPAYDGPLVITALQGISWLVA